jgi:hypothetical protein
MSVGGLGAIELKGLAVEEAGTDFVIVLCTGQLMEFDMAVAALTEAGIAHQVRAETATGLKLSLSVMPTMGPGNFFTVLVPASTEAEAKRALAELPFEIGTNPGAWDFAPQPTIKGWWKVLVVGVLALLILYFIYWIIGVVATLCS